MHRKLPVWTLQSARYAVPYIELLLRSMREVACRLAHFRRLVRKGDASKQPAFEKASEELAGHYTDLMAAGVYYFDNPARGIALFPSQLPSKNGCGPVDILFVYKDTQLAINTFVILKDLFLTNDLVACERPIPPEWNPKRKGWSRRAA